MAVAISVMGGLAIGGLTYLISLLVAYLIVVFPFAMDLQGVK